MMRIRTLVLAASPLRMYRPFQIPPAVHPLGTAFELRPVLAPDMDGHAAIGADAPRLEAPALGREVDGPIVGPEPRGHGARRPGLAVGGDVHVRGPCEGPLQIDVHGTARRSAC